jgi:homoserine O-succinyltransferase/O-acetyltransferase
MLIPAESYEEKVSRAEPIVIGLVNNMPDTALRSTERQFNALLSAASHDRAIRLMHFSMPGLPRSETAQAHLDENYKDSRELWENQLDGLIVTGTEPRTPNLKDEPYWETLAGLIDSVADHRISTVWSCLAAHAAVLQQRGVERQRMSSKLIGVFDCAKVEKHRIMAGVPARWSVPHSRYNDLPEEALVARGYRVLSRSADAGADLFIKEGESLDIFFQGHPEYRPDTLLGEYRRDVGRFLASERADYPELPRGYFDEDAVAALTAFRQQALQHRDHSLLSGFPSVTVNKQLSDAWHEPAVKIFTNWISYLAERKQCVEELRPLAE